MAPQHSSYSADTTALLKILLHAAKFPTSACSGVLLGAVRPAASPASPPSSPRAAQAPGVLQIQDAVPICHSWLTLAPVLETALAQIDQYLQQQQRQQQAGGPPPLRVVGYYQCGERLTDTELGAAGKRVADRLDTLYTGCVAVVLDAQALQALVRGEPKPVLQLCTKDGARGWVCAPAAAADGTAALGSFHCPAAGIAALLEQYTSEGRHRRLADFEDHLEDLGADWLNPGLLD